MHQGGFGWSGWNQKSQQQIFGALGLQKEICGRELELTSIYKFKNIIYNWFNLCHLSWSIGFQDVPIIGDSNMILKGKNIYLLFN